MMPSQPIRQDAPIKRCNVALEVLIHAQNAVVTKTHEQCLSGGLCCDTCTGHILRWRSASKEYNDALKAMLR